MKDKVKESELIGKVHSAVYQQCQQREYAGSENIICFPYPFREEMQKYEEKKIDEVCRIMRDKSEGISGIIPKVEDVFLNISVSLES